MIYSERISLPAWKRIILFLISVIFMLLQLGIFGLAIYFSIDSATHIGIIFAVEEISGLLLCFTVVRRNINANYKLTWCILILMLPVFFGVLYLLNLTSRQISKNKRTKMRNNVKKYDFDNAIEETKDINIDYYNAAKVVGNTTFAPVSNCSRFTFFKDAKEKDDDMFESLKKAEKYIFLEYFIISPGKLTDELLEILEERGNSGVIIKILYDDIGCRGQRNGKILKKLARIQNCEVCAYEALGTNLNILANYRNHRKLAVIDYKIAYCGGDNLADEYVHYEERFGYWRDNSGKYEGEAAFSFAIQFLEMWYASTKTLLEYDETIEIPKYESNGYVMPFTDGPQYVGNVTYDLFSTMISSAKKSIYISTPYFIIDDALLDLLELKCRQGLDVRILMPHIPDKKSAFYMGRERFGSILKENGKIYEFTRGFTHAKNIIIDDSYAYIGTANMDYRSLFLHFENGALVMNDTEIKKMSDDYINTINESELITLEKWLKRPIRQRLLAFFLNIFSPMF